MRQGHPMSHARRSEALTLEQGFNHRMSFDSIGGLGQIAQFMHQAFFARHGRNNAHRLGLEDFGKIHVSSVRHGAARLRPRIF